MKGTEGRHCEPMNVVAQIRRVYAWPRSLAIDDDEDYLSVSSLHRAQEKGEARP